MQALNNTGKNPISLHNTPSDLMVSGWDGEVVSLVDSIIYPESRRDSGFGVREAAEFSHKIQMYVKVFIKTGICCVLI